MIQIQLQPEFEAQLAAEAEARGVALDHYIVEKLEASRSAALSRRHSVSDAIDRLSSLPEGIADRRNEAVDAMMQFAERHGFTTGGQDLKSMVHEGHKY
jgi:anaerobic glycerol-3-phosphate dehydrogenase